MEFKQTVLKGQALNTCPCDPVMGKYANVAKHRKYSAFQQIEDILRITEGAYVYCKGCWEDKPSVCVLLDGHSLHTEKLSLAELQACASETLARRGRPEGSLLPLATLATPGPETPSVVGIHA